MFTVTECWAVEAQDPTVCEWVVYASRTREDKGDLVAMVPSGERSAVFDRPEGTWFTRVVGRRRDCSETPWETAPVHEHPVHGNDLAPPNPTTVGVGVVDPRLVGRVTYEPSEPDDHPHVVQVIQGPDEWRGVLLHEEVVEARGPMFPDGSRQKTVEFPFPGQAATTTVVVRTLGFGGCPGSTAVSRTVARPVVPGVYRVNVASISGTTRVNFPAAASTDAFEYDASDGVRAKAFPSWDNLTSDYGTYGPGGSWFDALAGAKYPTRIVVESDEVNLGESFSAFMLGITHTIQRKSATPASIPWEDQSYIPWDPQNTRGTAEEAESPAWNFRETIWDSRPRQPIRRWRFEYVIGTSAGVDHDDEDYVPYVFGSFLTGKFIRVRMVLEDPSGLYQLICPTLSIVALVPNVAGTAASLAHTTVHRETADVTVGNTTTETSIVNAGSGFTVPGGALGTNRLVELVIEGTYLNNTGATRNLQIKVKYGATTAIDATISTITQSANARSFRLTVRLYADGATNDQRATLEALFSAPGTPATGTGGFSDGSTCFTGRVTGDAAEDSTADKVLNVTVTHSTNDANLTLTASTVFASLR